MLKPLLLKLWIWLALVIVLAATAGALSHAAAQGSSPGSTIRFGVPGEYPPFAYWSPSGAAEGADVVTARRVAAELGADPIFVRTTWANLASDFSARRFDVAIGGLTVTPERAALGVFGPTMLVDGKRPLARCADRDRYAAVSAINQPGVRVEISQGSEIGALAKRWFFLAQLSIYPDAPALAEQLLASRADVWVTDGPVVDQMARRYPGRLCATTGQPFTTASKAWLIQNDPNLVSKIGAEISIAIESGVWRRAIQAER